MDIIKELEKLRRNHYCCDDCYYSCPKAEDGCCDDQKDDECDCGAEEKNKILDNIIEYLTDNKEINRT